MPAAMQRSVTMLFTADADAPFTPGSIGAIANQKIAGSSLDPRRIKPIAFEQFVKVVNNLQSNVEEAEASKIDLRESIITHTRR